VYQECISHKAVVEPVELGREGPGMECSSGDGAPRSAYRREAAHGRRTPQDHPGHALESVAGSRPDGDGDPGLQHV
jgi:hypothetical protein